MSLSHKLFSGIRYNFSSEAILVLSSFIFTPILILSLGVGRFGILVLAQTVIGLATMIDFGFKDVIVRYGSQAIDKRNLAELKQVFTYSLGSLLLTAIPMTLITGLSGQWLVTRVFSIETIYTPEAFALFSVLPLLVLVTYIGFISISYLQAAERFDLINLRNLTQGLVGSAGYVLLVKAGFGLPVLILVSSLVQLSFNLGFLIYVYLKQYLVLGFAINKSNLHKYTWYGFQRQANNLFAVTSNQLPKFVLGIFASSSVVSFFAVPWQIMERLSSVTLLVTSVLYPHISRLAQSARQQVAHIYHLVFVHISMLLIPGFVILAINANQFLSLWINPEFAAQSTDILVILCLAGIFRSLISIPGVTLASLDRPDINTKFSAFYVIWLFSAGIGLAYYFTDLGISLAVMIGKLFHLAVYVYYANLVSGFIEYRRFGKMSTMSLAAGIALIISWPMSLFFTPNHFVLLIILMGLEYLLAAGLFIKVGLLDYQKISKLLGLRFSRSIFHGTTD